MDDIELKIDALKKASVRLSSSTSEERNEALSLVSSELKANAEYIFSENRKDLLNAEGKVSSAVMKRLLFDEGKLSTVVSGIESIIAQKDPVGRVIERRELDEGLILSRVSVPIGVIGMIFEARPDALVQMAALAIKSGNALILKGGSEALLSNRALYETIVRGLEKSRLGSGYIMLLESREDVSLMLGMSGKIDLLIPRGSNEFVKYIMHNTDIPVLGHADGICSVYIDESADINIAVKVAVDSKIQYPAACNAAETILVNRLVADSFLPRFAKELKKNNVKVHADMEAISYFEDAIPAEDTDWKTEYLSMECAVKTVGSLEEAIEHIAKYSSHHTDAIITESDEAWTIYRNSVDSADVFRNCSTRFADGYRFGLGAEVGISTSKIHARGPVGIEGLMSYKYELSGNGHRVSDYSGKDARSFTHKELEV